MKYQAEFSSLNDIRYKIEITTKSGSGTKEITLSENPFITEMNLDEDLLYSPMRTTGATVSLVTDMLIFDLYSGKAKDVKVSLTNMTDNKVEWIGYTTPCAYNMGFDYVVEEIQLECIDGLSVLQYIPYRVTGTKTEVKTFLDVIFNCLKSAEVFKYLYISDNVQMKSVTATDSVCEIFRVNESNFFNEAEDKNQTLDDLAWNCLDVLTELCRFLGYTMVCEGESVYMIDYDAIRKGKNTYWRYNISGSTYSNKTYVTINHSKYISDIADYSDSGNSMSLSEVYNKVTVKDEFYTFEDVFLSSDDDNTEVNITHPYDNSEFNKLNTSTPNLGGCYLLADTLQDRNGEWYLIFIGKSWKGVLWVCIFKFYSSDMYDYSAYNMNSTRSKANLGNYRSYMNLFQYHGAYKVKWYQKRITSAQYNSWRVNGGPEWHRYGPEWRHDMWIKLLNSDPQSINLKPMIIFMNKSDYHIGPAASNRTGKYDPNDDNEDVKKYPYVSLKSGFKASAVFGGPGSYIIIKGTFRQHDEQVSPYPLANGESNGKLKRDDDEKYNCQAFQWARLKWGDLYWSGNSWTNTPSDFKLFFGEGNANDPMSRSDKYTFKVRDYWDKDLQIQDTARVDFGCDDSGYYIPAPTTGNLQGSAEFILYANRDMYGCSDHGHWKPKNNNRYSRYYNYCQFLTGFSIKTYKAASDLTGESDDSDTIYYNVINPDNIMEGPEITFKVCTYDNKRSTYSMVDYLDSNNNSQYVKFTYNKALHSDLTSSDTKGCDETVAYLRQEEHLVYKIVTQYENPRVILELNLKNIGYKLYGLYTDKTLSSKSFVPMTISTDYKYNKQAVKLIEKV